MTENEAAKERSFLESIEAGRHILWDDERGYMYTMSSTAKQTFDRMLKRLPELKTVEEQDAEWNKAYPKRPCYHENPVTWLQTCGICGWVSTPKNVTYRSDVHKWYLPFGVDDGYDSSKEVLCVGCWNKARAISKMKEGLRDVKKTTYRLKEERRALVREARIAEKRGQSDRSVM